MFHYESLQLSKLERFFLERLETALRPAPVKVDGAPPDCTGEPGPWRLSISRLAQDESILVLDVHGQGLTAQFHGRMHGYQPAIYHFVRKGPNNSAAGQFQSIITQILGHENLISSGGGSWRYQCIYPQDIQRHLR